MTSNIGADKFKASNSLGFLSSIDCPINEKLRAYFKDEFINRLDETILFSPLDHSALKQIAKIKISDISDRIKAKSAELAVNESVYDYLAEKSQNSRGFGARPLTRLITTAIENKLADILLCDQQSTDIKIRVSISDGDLVVERIVPALKGEIG
jgi:ATP-dependent Clp protease ATP-binding subunit ClpC